MGSTIAIVDYPVDITKVAEQYPDYLQSLPSNLNSKQAAAGATVVWDTVLDTHAYGVGVLAVTITGDGTATIGIDITLDNVNYFRYGTALATGLTKTSGNAGKCLIPIPKDLMGVPAVRPYLTETGGANTVTAAMTGWCRR